jgi:hypothetical protein
MRGRDMITVEYNKSEHTFVVSGERIENGYFLFVIEHGSIETIKRAIRERLEKRRNINGNLE